MSQQQDPQPYKHGDALAFAHRITDAFFACFQPFLRKRSGRESPGVAGVFAILILLVVGGFDQTRLTYLYMPVWFVAILVRRIETLRIRDSQLHSHYGGYPFVAMWFPFINDEDKAKAIIEPAMLFFGGILLMSVSEVFGQFTAFCGVMALARFVINHAIVTKRIQKMQDAKIEGEFYAERLRQGEWS
jgi:hypothetical protein